MGATAVTPAAPPRKGPLGGVSARLLKVASDERLVALVRQGSQPAFEVVFDRHHRGILSFCRHMLGSREEAEDAVQHTFMAAYKDLVGSEKDIQLRAWLYTIARNRCLSVLRARREQPSDDIEIASVDGLSTQVERRVDLQDMLRDLAGLPAEQREALVLSEIGDMGHDEIARILDVPKDKVKALVFQARSSLHQSREARETSCQEIQEMLATLTGGALRRTNLRRHVKECGACQAFEADVKRQRRAMAAVLPVIPTLGFKESALAAAFGQSAAAGGIAAGGAATAGGLLSGGSSAMVAKVLVVATVAAGGAAGVSAVNDDARTPTKAPATQTSEPAQPSGGAPVVPATAPVTEAEREQAKAEREKARKAKKAKKGKRRGQTDRGKEFAKEQGKGKKRGLNGTQPGKNKAAKAKSKEKAKVKAQQRTARKQAAKQKAKAKARAQRPAKPRPTPTPPPKPDPKPAPPSKPSTPNPVPTVVPTIDPGKALDGVRPDKKD